MLLADARTITVGTIVLYRGRPYRVTRVDWRGLRGPYYSLGTRHDLQHISYQDCLLTRVHNSGDTENASK